jgi:homoserine dehydrogenase
MAEVFKIFTAPDNIFCKGISTLSPDDVLISKELNCSIRLLGIGEIDNGELRACVEPCIIPDKYFLAQARGGSEIVYAQDVDGGSQVYACPGTTNQQVVKGILSDLSEVNCQKRENVEVQSHCSSIPGKFYLRISIINLADTLSQICGIFVENSIEIESVFQNFKKLVSRETDDIELEAVFFTGETSNQKIAEVCRIIGEKARLATVKSCFRFIR